jgi:glycine/D-amino acid oxidase-like deaminating enzyme
MTGRPRIGVVGSGIAGALLGWRLARAGAAVTVHTGPAGPDATALSGGLVRGFEPDPGTCRLAAESLAELLGHPTLARAAAYRPTASTYVLADPADLDRPLKELDERLPGAATVVDRAGLLGWHGLPAGAVGVLERRAGYISVDQLRRFALSSVARVPAPADVLDLLPAFDAVVLATGRWTPALLAAAGLPGGFRTRSIQYGLHPGRVPTAFVDETTGLYGRPAGDGLVLLGVPSDEWDVPPALDDALTARSVALARDRFGAEVGAPVRMVTGADAYSDPPLLALRAVPGVEGLHTFTGGSGGAAKYALAASRAAAGALL